MAGWIRRALSATDGVDDFQSITGLQAGGGMLAARHYVEVQFDAHAALGQAELGQQVGNALAFTDIADFTVEMDTHGRELSATKGAGHSSLIPGSDQAAVSRRAARRPGPGRPSRP